jgi:GNAT superfamily N-acetyltransferase
MTMQHESVLVRNLRPRDLDAVIHLDSKITGRKRTEYFKVKLAQALSDTGIVVSLAAEYDGQFVGFLLARVWYGEFGATEQTAVLDTIGVNPNVRGKGVGTALLRQLRQNLLGLGIKARHRAAGVLPARGLPAGTAPVPRSRSAAGAPPRRDRRRRARLNRLTPTLPCTTARSLRS